MAVNRRVAGSNPARGAKLFKHLHSPEDLIAAPLWGVLWGCCFTMESIAGALGGATERPTGAREKRLSFIVAGPLSGNRFKAGYFREGSELVFPLESQMLACCPKSEVLAFGKRQTRPTSN